MDHERGMGHARQRYDDEEDEDQNAIYIGIPPPQGYRRKRRRRKWPTSREKTSDGEWYPERQERSDTDEGGERVLTPVDSASIAMSPAAERLRYILGEDYDGPTPTLFTEMDTLQHDGDELEWKESARWVKFEEKVEEGGERWSKPHVSTLSLHSLFELRTCLQTETVLLDLDGYSLPQIIDDIIDKQIEDGLIKAEVREQISYILLRKHRHQTKKPIHRSLVDIGKSSTTSSARSPNRMPGTGTSFYRSTEDLGMRQAPSSGRLRRAQSRSMNDIADTPSTDQLKNKFKKKIPRDSEASNILVGEVDFLDKPFVAFVRLLQSTMLGGLTEVAVPTRFIFILLGPQGKGKSYSEIGRAMATLMVDDLFSDVAYKARDRDDLIAGIDEFLDEVIVLPPGEWDPKIRIEPPKKVTPAEKRKSVYSLNEAGQMNGSAGGGGGSDDEEMPAPHELGEELMWTGRFCGGLILDIKRKLPWMPSDFYEAFHIQSVSTILFIYLGCITNAITFGGLLGDATENYQGVIESFLGTAFTGTVFCLFGGQPLTILSSTGPILIFEKLLFDFSKSNKLDYLEFRLWIGLHSALQCLFLVATDASFIIKYITRFTEEGFSMLISFIFIYDAIKKIIGAFKYYPINVGYKPDYVTMYKCECVAPYSDSLALNNANISLYNIVNATTLDWSQLSKKECFTYGGNLVGKSCKYIPDLALMSFILFFGTYTLTVTLKKFKFSRYFPTKIRSLITDFSTVISILVFCGVDAAVGLDTPKLHVPSEIKLRKLISDFSIFTSILIFVGIDILFGLNTPKLQVPTELKPTRSDRSWFVIPFGKNPWWIYLASALPALLVTILIFMDQQITGVIVNRKEHKLRKGAGYHLDLFWVGLLLAICSFMGLPWYVAATVISIAHIDGLKMETETSAPGEHPQFLGVREQRLTGVVVFVLTGVSVFLAPILKYIPMAVLYGIFLYMGVASLNGIQFWDRCKLFLMPSKHQPDYTYLRHVPLRRVHLFTTVQVICFGVLWVLKSTVAAIIFPIMILALIVVRKLLDWVFSQHDLAWLDDILPEKDKKEEDKKKKKSKTKDQDRDSIDEGNGPLAGAMQAEMSHCNSDSLDRSITLHLKISCPSTPAFNYSQNAICSVPQVKIEMESDYDDTDTEKAWRDTGGETTL
ncbi:electrogenic sodium bicarbonate cotransporter 4 isoform X2 [Scyliorhinus canicula]|uniref:electrogenic sodium bicarbonate cotransporter 4 isoform X2 n=1 Tax=Scyliorhinus canicula TaxID=7830 RepID=UPI0018F3B448|nr:electrogenic sodium bicarbonate cotransporter 4 isoform X2 [Scyliorhinus canicula]